MRRAIILSGISGSGKSYYAKQLHQANLGSLMVSADNYFITPAGTYHFDPSKLQEAHNQCFRNYLSYLMWDVCRSSADTTATSDNGLIIVDNTNTGVEEIAPYMLAASAYGYQPELITFSCTLEQVPLCAARNSHNVPLYAVDRQWHKLNDRRVPSWWKTSTVWATFPNEKT